MESKKGLRWIVSISLILFLGGTFVPSILAKKPKKPTPTPSPVTLAERNIITFEGGKERLTVWGLTGDNDYSNIWTAEDVIYSSLAIGDIDGIGTREIVGARYCKLYEGKRNGPYFYKAFINVYREKEEGVEDGIWTTTYYEDSNNISEPDSPLGSELILNDVDGDGINEIVMLTTTHLAVYKFNSDVNDVYTQALQKIADCQLSSGDLREGTEVWLRLQSMSVGDIDNDRNKEIIAVGHLVSISNNMGYVFIYNLSGPDTNGEYYLTEKQKIEVPYNFSKNSLRAGDLDGDGLIEFCSTAYSQSGTYPNDSYTQYLLVWDDYENGGAWDNPYVYQINPGDTTYQMNYMDIGNLDDNPNQDEIAVLLRSADELVTYSWSPSGLTEMNRINLDSSIAINRIAIGDSNNDSANEIVIGGYKKVRNKQVLYLATYDKNFSLLWEMVQQCILLLSTRKSD